MIESQNSLKTQKLAVGGMTCVNCEVLVERRFKAIPGVERVRVNLARGYVEIDHHGDLAIDTLQHAIEEDGYAVSPWDERAAAARENTPKDYAEIMGMFAVLIGVVFAIQHFGLMPRGLAVSETMSLSLVFLIGLVASISSCMAVTGGLLVAAAAAYNENSPNLPGIQRLKPHIYFNAGRIVSYTLLGGAVGALGSVLTLSAETNGFLTLAASAIMIVLGLQMLGLLPRFGRFLLPKSIAHKVHDLASRKVAGGAFTLGALTFFLPCGFTQALQLYVLGKGSFTTGALTMLVFALGTLPALLSLSALSSFAKGAFQKRFLRIAGAAVIVLGVLNIEYGLVLTGLGAQSTAAVGEVEEVDDTPVRATQVNGKQVVSMKIVDFTYIPHVFEVTQGVPVEWRIDASEAVGCGQFLLSPRLGVRRLLSPVSTTFITFTPRASRRVHVQLRHGDDDAGIEVHRRPGRVACRFCEKLPEGAIMKTTTFGIGGMHCASCSARNERTLKKLAGVLDASVNFGTHSARVVFDESAISERGLHQAVIDNGYQVLTREFAQDHKARAQRELQAARQRAYLALLLAVPVTALAMFEIDLPWQLYGHNLSIWIQALLSSAVILGLGWEFHIGMLRQARNASANMDTLISLGTLAALFYSLWAMAAGEHHLYFETGAVIAALILLGPLFRGPQPGPGERGHREADRSWREERAPRLGRRGAGYRDRGREGRAMCCW